ncbi:MAG: type II toxin-antitoxin system Phd/YefM family antitoxin [Hyphomicrobiales bacterium]|nr:type II toxin-antitoxin system Phd/YefM family antitoxin [Hyphomicrobiales bacterium]
MDIVTIPTAKSTLSKLVKRVEAGEEIILASGQVPIAKIVPLQPASNKRQFGAFRGMITVGPEFFEPLTDDELAGWE